MPLSSCLQLLRRRPHIDHVPTPDGEGSVRASTPINVKELRKSLRRHPNRCFISFLLFGLLHGFVAGLSYLPLVSFSCPNLLSALNDPISVDNLLAKEVEKGYIVGPYNSPPFSKFRISPLGLATRKYSGKKRLIIDLSAPRKGTVESINDIIPKDQFSLAYSSVDHAIKLISIAGRGAWLAKADIVDAFKVIPLHPSQWHLFCIRWRDKFYFSVRLTFGCRSSPSLFNNLSEALCWILLNEDKLPFVLHLLDDFLLIDFPSPEPSNVLDRLTRTFNRLGVPLSEEKTIGPSQRLEFLGIILDSNRMQASLPLDKLNRIRESLNLFLEKPSLSKRELLSLLGHLNFAMRIIPQGRSFISRLLELAKSVENLSDVVRLDEGCRSDIKFWCHLCNHWNGISFFYILKPISSIELRFFTDATPAKGFGGFFKDQWFSASWPIQITSLPQSSRSSALFEMYPIVIACLLWGSSWTKKQIVVMSDNMTVVHIINKGRSSNAFINRMCRRVTWTSIMNNFQLKAAHVPGVNNKAADCLSRFEFQAFHQLCPQAREASLPCPPFQAVVMD